MDIVLSACIMAGDDPFRTITTKLGKLDGKLAEMTVEDKLAYMAPLLETVKAHKLNAVILHDGLPTEIIDRDWGTLRFLAIESRVDVPNHEARFFGYRDFLATLAPDDRVWIVDVNDIAFVAHPFEWWDSLPLRHDVILAGEEHNAYRGNQWFEESLAVIPQRYSQLLIEEHGELLAINCGAWATRAGDAHAIISDMIPQADIIRIEAQKRGATFQPTSDMFAFALTLLTKYAGRLATFRMNGDQPWLTPGVHLRHHVAPLIHDRQTALAYQRGTAWFTFRQDTNDRIIFDSVVTNNEYRLPESMEGQHVLDIGGHIGSFAHACLVRGAARVMSIEAAPDNFAKLQENMSTHGDRFSCRFGAAWRSDLPETMLRICSGGRNTGGHRISADGELTIGFPFDKIVDEFTDNGRTRINLLKLDCEGAEFPILFTSRRLHLVDAICAEIHPWISDCQEMAVPGFELSEESLHAVLAGFEITRDREHLWARIIDR